MKTQRTTQIAKAIFWLTLSLTILAAINANAQKTTYHIQAGYDGQIFQVAFADDTLNAQTFEKDFKVSVYKDEQEIDLILAYEEMRVYFTLPYVKEIRKIDLLLDDGYMIYLEDGQEVYRYKPTIKHAR